MPLSFHALLQHSVVRCDGSTKLGRASEPERVKYMENFEVTYSCRDHN
jgi:hypothetical protein